MSVTLLLCVYVYMSIYDWAADATKNPLNSGFDDGNDVGIDALVDFVHRRL